MAQEVRQLERRIEATEARAIEFLEMTAEQLRALAQRSEEEEQLLGRVDQVLADLRDENLLAEVEQTNAALRVRNAELANVLRRKVEGRICFVGYTAAAVADMVNTPVFRSTPGVMAHANVVNSFLQGRFPRLAPRWMNTLLIVLAGAVVTLVTASRGPWVSLICVLLLVPLILAGSFVLFAGRLVYVAMIVAAMAVFVCWAFITLYRQLVEQRARRQFSRALAQYTSPAVAAQIARDTDPQDLAPHPGDVTCFFSDLQGFTAISERLGAERTRAILNPYLEAMSQVLNDHKAIINKFMGDGIFAFFNPPILACPEHQRAACEAALDSLAALERLKEDHAGGLLGRETAALFMRIGINSGAVFVGDYGSANKLDYTCIGDAVNLAARLEPANKVFGTAIMISGETRSGVGDAFELRPLGRLQVAGKLQAIPVYELLGRRGQVPDERRRYADAFGELVGHFGERRWKEAMAALQRCADLNSGDPALALYREHIERLRQHPPPDDWNRGIELTGK
jgi:adenylate cyclase